MAPAPTFYQIRKLSASELDKIDVIALRMRDTLAEVIGPEGYGMYSLDWLRDRALSHIDGRLHGEVQIAVAFDECIGHVIAREELRENGAKVGLISTVYVVPEARRRGVGSNLIAQTEQWLINCKVEEFAMNTATNNTPLLELLKRRGYAITFHDENSRMVQLSKVVHHGAS